MRALLADNPLLILFAVCTVGCLLGRLRFRRISVGVSGVLFAGLAMGALDPSFALPEIVYELGLALFVYTMALSCAPTFRATLRAGGLQLNALCCATVLLIAGSAGFAAHLFGQAGAAGAGLFTGVLTNAPGLAGALDALSHTKQGPAARDQLVVAYSLAYPVAVVASLAALAAARKIFRVDYHAEAEAAGIRDASDGLVASTVEVTAQTSVAGLADTLEERVVLTRLARDGTLTLVGPDTEALSPGDQVTVVGTAAGVADATAQLGTTAPLSLTKDRTTFDSRRVFVSDPRLAGVSVESLALLERFGARITRVRRGDVDLVAGDDTVLELGDRVRVVAPAARMAEVSALFGDSYRALAEIDFGALALGLTVGLALGLIRVPLPGGLTLSLGLAGGPLLAGLVLGARRRTGPLTWQLPFTANITLRQIGLVLFLAGIGTRGGHAFAAAVFTATGAAIIASAVVLTTLAALCVVWVGHKCLRLPLATCAGLLAGTMTQPATLVFATEQAGNELPEAAYTAVYPLATLAKVLLAQLMVPIAF